MFVKELAGVCHAVGLDPFLGSCTSPAMAALPWPWTSWKNSVPVIADSVAISIINRGEIGPEDFIKKCQRHCHE